MDTENSYRVVSLASGGLYGPFKTEALARSWAEREFPGHVWNVLPIQRVETEDSCVGVFALTTYRDAA